MEIQIDIPDSQAGDWKVETFVVKENDFLNYKSLFTTGRYVKPGTYKRLMHGKTVVMSNTPDEIKDFRYFYNKAAGHVLINGLGLGVLVKALLGKEGITKITIIEKSLDVINLVSKYLKDTRVEIINCDCFEYTPPRGTRYNAVWHDIWDNICSDNLEEMKRLHRKYGKRCDYQASWCRVECKAMENSF